MNNIQQIECMDCSFCQKFKNLNKWAIADSFAYFREMKIYEDRLAIKCVGVSVAEELPLFLYVFVIL